MKIAIKNKLKKINLDNGYMILNKLKKDFNPLSSKEIEEIEEEIRLIQIDLELKKINIFDMDREIEKIENKYNLNSDELIDFQDKVFDLEISFKEKCKKYKSTKQNNSYFIASSILEAICLNSDIGISKEPILFKDSSYFSSNSNSKDIVEILDKSVSQEALRVLRCLGILHSREKKYKLTTYNLDSQSRYKIKNKNVLANLMPLLLAYVSKTYGVSTPNFLEKIDSVIEDILLNSEAHNKNFDIEFDLTILKNEDVELITNTANYRGVVSDIIFINENEEIKKYVKLKSLENEEILISSIINIKLAKNININNKDYPPLDNNDLLSSSNYSNNSNFEIENKQNNSAKFIEVILEVDNIVSDYFDIKPFNTMVQYKTQEELANFYKMYEFETKPNKFYITARDGQEQIIAILFNSLEHIKILKAPKSLKVQMLKKIKIFTEKNNIDICEEFCEDKEDDTPNDKPPSSNGGVGKDNLNGKNKIIRTNAKEAIDKAKKDHKDIKDNKKLLDL